METCSKLQVLWSGNVPYKDRMDYYRVCKTNEPGDLRVYRRVSDPFGDPTWSRVDPLETCWIGTYPQPRMREEYAKVIIKALGG